MPTPVLFAPAASLVNWKRPFWLFVLPGIGCTLIWSKSSWPEYSTITPALNVWRPFRNVVALLNV